MALLPGTKKPIHDQNTLPVPAHWIPLLNEFGEQIVPGHSLALPVSTRQTCGTCHDYETIAQGWHFNAPQSSSFDGRPGEPWVWVDTTTGTQIPLSYRNWEGLWKPRELGLSAWDFTQLFARHIPGGGIAEPSGFPMDPQARWHVSGKLEINCFACHHHAREQDMSEWAKQIGRQNLRWASTASSGLGTVGGMVSRIADTWQLFDGPELDDKDYAIPPYVQYDANRFNSSHQVLVDIDDSPQDRRCLYCHSVKPWNEKKDPLSRNDVHRSAGLSCTDCHNHGLDHHITRGMEDETASEAPVQADASCKRCHLPQPSSSDSSRMAGWLGAPLARHKGLPSIHLDKLTCTACHSGPWPKETPTQVQVSRANRLGIHGAARWDREAPAIAQPVFVRNKQGKIEPRRMMWPAFWARMDESDLIPLNPAQVEEAGQGILDMEAQLGRLLFALAGTEQIEGEPVFLAHDRLYACNIDGLLDPVVYAHELPTDSLPFCVLVEQTLVPLLSDLKQEFTGLSEMEKTLPPEQQQAILERKESFLDEEAALVEHVLKAVQWEEEGDHVRVVSYGSRTYRIDDEGRLHYSRKPGRVASLIQWGWLSREGAQSVSPHLIDRAQVETLGFHQGITAPQVLSVLERLQEIPDKKGFPVFVNQGKVYCAGKIQTLEEVDLFIDIPESNVSWMWMTPREAIPLVPAFDPAESPDGREYQRILAVLKAIENSELFSYSPVCCYKGIVYQQIPTPFVEIPQEEAETLRRAQKEAAAAVEAFKEKHGLLSFNNIRFYRLSDPEKSLSRTDPLLQELAPLLTDLKSSDDALSKIHSFGRVHFREETDSHRIGAIPFEESGLDLSKVKQAALSPDTVPVFGLVTEQRMIQPLCMDLWSDILRQTQGDESLLTESQILHTLLALAGNEIPSFCYIALGKLFRIDENGGLSVEDHPKAQPYSWAFAHDVRPAGQSLGIHGCQDCHHPKAPFFFGQVKAMGPLITEYATVQSMFQLQGVDSMIQALTGTSFLFRTYIGWALLALCGLIAAILGLFGFKALDRLTRFLEDPKG